MSSRGTKRHTSSDPADHPAKRRIVRSRDVGDGVAEDVCAPDAPLAPRGPTAESDFESILAASDTLLAVCAEPVTSLLPAHIITTPAPVPSSDSAGNQLFDGIGRPPAGTAVGTVPGVAHTVAPLAGIGNKREGRLSLCDEALVNRIHNIQNFADATRNTYAAHNVPKDATWGVPSAFNSTATVLCQKGTTRPITVWIVGELSESWFFDVNRQPAARVSTTILPLNPEIRRVCAEQIRTFSEPKMTANGADKWGHEQIRASKWMNGRKRNEPTGPRSFDSIFDATERLRDKSLMATMSPEELEPHDIVLLETQICRYRLNKDESEAVTKGRTVTSTSSKPSTAFAGGWTRWVAYYDLRAVYVLQRAPESFTHLSTTDMDGSGLDL